MSQPTVVVYIPPLNQSMFAGYRWLQYRLLCMAKLKGQLR